MKKILLTALMAVLVNSAFAQWYVYRNSTETPNFIRIYGSFNYTSMKETIGGQSLSFNPLGITVGAVLSPNLTINTLHRMPLFLESGIEATYNYGHTNQYIVVNGKPAPLCGGSNHVELKDADGNDYNAVMYEGAERKINMISASVPVNLTYSFDFSNGKLSIVPLIGANFRFNIISKVTEGDNTYNLVKNEDVNLFQFGLNAGVSFVIVRGFYAGYRLQYDIMEYADNVKTMSHSLQIGYRF